MHDLSSALPRHHSRVHRLEITGCFNSLTLVFSSLLICTNVDIFPSNPYLSTNTFFILFGFLSMDSLLLELQSSSSLFSFCTTEWVGNWEDSAFLPSLTSTIFKCSSAELILEVLSSSFSEELVELFAQQLCTILYFLKQIASTI